MIVDVHTHSPTHRDVVPPEDVKFNTRANNLGPVRMTNTWADYDAGTAAADVTLVFNIQGRGEAIKEPGETVDPLKRATAEFAAANPTRRIGFMSVNPRFAGYLDEVDGASHSACAASNWAPTTNGSTRSAHLHGVVPAGPGPRPADPVPPGHLTRPDRAAPLRPPAGDGRDRHRVPGTAHRDGAHGAPVAPGTPSPRSASTPTCTRTSRRCASTVVLYEAMTLATEWGVTDKLLFGSDFPIVTPQRTIDALRSANDPVAGTSLPKISAEMIERIIHADALGALGLSGSRHPLAVPSRTPVS